jgi:hypothetical protein
VESVTEQNLSLAVVFLRKWEVKNLVDRKTAGGVDTNDQPSNDMTIENSIIYFCNTLQMQIVYDIV